MKEERVVRDQPDVVSSRQNTWVRLKKSPYQLPLPINKWFLDFYESSWTYHSTLYGLSSYYSNKSSRYSHTVRQSMGILDYLGGSSVIFNVHINVMAESYIWKGKWIPKWTRWHSFPLLIRYLESTTFRRSNKKWSRIIVSAVSSLNYESRWKLKTTYYSQIFEK